MTMDKFMENSSYVRPVSVARENFEPIQGLVIKNNIKFRYEIKHSKKFHSCFQKCISTTSQ